MRCLDSEIRATHIRLWSSMMFRDLSDRSPSESHVRDVHLPTLVVQIGFEADAGALGPLLRLGDHEAPAVEHPPDARDGRGSAMARCRCA